MKIGPYRLIILLISFCLLAIMSIQVYWILNSYHQKKEAFQRDVYSAMEFVSKKMSEKETMKSIHQSIIVEKDDTVIVSTDKRKVSVYSKTQLSDLKKMDTLIRLKKPILNQTLRVQKDSNVIAGTKIVKLNIDSDMQWMDSSISDIHKKEEKIKSLIKQMLLEIQLKDSADNESPAPLIEKALQLKGILIPFEYSYRKSMSSKELLISQSKAFIPNEKFFTYDLGAEKIIDTRQFLYLQFPNQQNFVLAGMKSSLILSVIFLLIIISIFYTTIRLILKQKRISEIKSDFVNNMTHELKTPIATIAIAIDAINNPLIKEDPKKFEEYREILKEENSKLNRHVERVLQMAMMDKGELNLHLQELDLIQLLQEVMDSFKLQLQHHQIQVHFYHSENKLPFKGDAEHLKTVFGNLIDNAIKYSKEHATLEITVKRNGAFISIHVKDNGIGIDTSVQNKVFEKFYRAQSGNLHDVKGFGLGLAFVKSIVEAHGGSVQLLSEKNKGTEFIIQFNSHA